MSVKPIKVNLCYSYVEKYPDFTGCLINNFDVKVWYLNGECHRTDGPAIEYPDGIKEWWINGKYHRTNGPAIEYPDGIKEWWLNGERLTEQEHRLKVRHIKLKLLDIDQHSL